MASKGEGNERLLGASLVRSGDDGIAIPLLEKGQKRAWDHLFLAIAHAHLNQTDIATEYFRTAESQIKNDFYPPDEEIANRSLFEECQDLLNQRVAPNRIAP